MSLMGSMGLGFTLSSKALARPLTCVPPCSGVSRSVGHSPASPPIGRTVPRIVRYGWTHVGQVTNGH